MVKRICRMLALCVLLVLTAGLVEEGLVPEENAIHVLSNEDSSRVVYGEKEYTTYPYTSVEGMEYLEYIRLEITTIVKEDGTYERSIGVVIPKKYMTDRGDEIVAYMESIVPEGATLEREENANNAELSFIVKKDGMSLEDLNLFTQDYFGSEDCILTITDSYGYHTSFFGSVISSTIPRVPNPFRMRKTYYENIDFSELFQEEMPQMFQPILEYKMVLEDGFVSTNGSTDVIVEQMALHESMEIYENTERWFQPVSVDIETKIRGKNRYNEVISTRFDHEFRPQDEERILSAFLGDTDETMESFKQKYGIDFVFDGDVLTITRKGTAQEMTDSAKAIFSDATYMYTTDDQPFKLFYEVSAGIQTGSPYKVIMYDGEGCTYTHSISLPFGCRITESTVDGDGTMNRYQISGGQSWSNVIISGKGVNYGTLGIYVTLLLTIVAVLWCLHKQGRLQPMIATLSDKVRALRTEDVIKEVQPVKKEADPIVIEYDALEDIDIEIDISTD